MSQNQGFGLGLVHWEEFIRICGKDCLSVLDLPRNFLVLFALLLVVVVCFTLSQVASVWE